MNNVKKLICACYVIICFSGFQFILALKSQDVVMITKTTTVMSALLLQLFFYSFCAFNLLLQLLPLFIEINEKCFVRYYAIAGTCSTVSWQIFRRKHRDLYVHIKKLSFVLIRFASDDRCIKKH